MPIIVPGQVNSVTVELCDSDIAFIITAVVIFQYLILFQFLKFVFQQSAKVGG